MYDLVAPEENKGRDPDELQIDRNSVLRPRPATIATFRKYKDRQENGRRIRE